MASRDPLKLLAGALGATEAAVICLLSLLSFAAGHGLRLIDLDVVWVSVLASVLTVNFLWLGGAYGDRLKSGFFSQARTAFQAWTSTFLILLAIGFLTKTTGEYSRFWGILWYVSVVVGLLGIRLLAVMRLSRWRDSGRLAETVAIVDLVGRGAEFSRRITQASPEVRLAGVFMADKTQPSGRDVSDLIALSRLFRIDEVIVLVGQDLAGQDCQTDQLPAILQRLGTIPTAVRICAVSLALDQPPIHEALLLHNVPLFTVHRRPLGAWSSVAKRIEDLMIGSLALILFGPLMLAVSVAIKLDSPGPILFRQARQGFNNNVITVFKFRSMRHAPDGNQQVVQAVRNDRRVTRLGRILRRTSIDELPQIFNVLRGEMSLVGPRPHAIAHNDQYAALINDYCGRHRVQPGITGWAQVNGLRGETDTIDKMRKRVEYDLAYIENWSILFDIKIMILTVVSIFTHKAY